jgi:hypothetical protein
MMRFLPSRTYFLLSDIVPSLAWFHRTKLYERIAVHLCVRSGGLLAKQLSTDETFAQSVTTHDKNLADLVGAAAVRHLAPPW